MLTKETGILFILLILIQRIIFNDRKQIIPFLGCGFIILLVYCLIRFGIGGVYFDARELATIAKLSLLERIVNIPAIIFYYLKTFFFPVTFAIDQMWIVARINVSDFFAPLLIDTLFFVLVGIYGRYLFYSDKKIFKIYTFFTAWFIIGLGLHLQIFPLDLTVADRWFYFPMVGLLGIIGTVLHVLIKANIKFKVIGFSIAIIIISLLSIRTIVRNTDWVDAMTLYTHDTKINDNWDMENNLAAEYGFAQNYQEDLRHGLKSLEFFSYEVNIYNVGYDYEKLGNYQKAIEYYNKALHANTYNSITTNHKHNLEVYVRLSQLLLFQEHKTQEAKIISKLGVTDYPDSPYLRMELAISEYKLRNQKEAVYAIKKAEAISPNDNLINYVYGKIISKQPILIK